MVLLENYKEFDINYDNDTFTAYRKPASDEVSVSFDAKELSALKKKVDKWQSASEIKKRVAEKERAKEKLEKEKEAEELRKRNFPGYMAEVNGLLFLNFLKRLNNFTHEVFIQSEKDKLFCITLDPANVMMIKSTVSIVTKTENTSFSINARQVTEMLEGLVKPNDMLFLKGVDKKKLEIVGPNYTAKVNLLPSDENIKTKPELTFDHVHECTWKELQKIINACNKIGGTVQFIVEKGCLTMRGNHEDADHKLDVYWATEDTKKKVKAKFSGEYLAKVNFNEDDVVKIHLKTDYPLLLEDTKDNSFILAPRVDND